MSTGCFRDFTQSKGFDVAHGAVIHCPVNTEQFTGVPVSAARKTQVIFTTHSASFLDAFPKAEAPTVTVARRTDGETHLERALVQEVCIGA